MLGGHREKAKEIGANHARVGGQRLERKKQKNKNKSREKGKEEASEEDLKKHSEEVEKHFMVLVCCRDAYPYS